MREYVKAGDGLTLDTPTNEMVFKVYEPFVKTRQSDDSGAFVFQLNPDDVARAIAAKNAFKALGEFEIVLRPLATLEAVVVEKKYEVDPSTGEVSGLDRFDN